MPKSTNKKNTKEKKVTKPATSKNSTSKKVNTKFEKKVETKKFDKKQEKRVTTKKNDVKPEKKVEVKEVVKETKERKETKDSLITRVLNDTPLVIAICIILVLIAILIFVGCSKRIPKTKDGKEIVATLKGKTITADDLYIELKNENGTDKLMSIVDEYIANKEYPKLNSDDKKYVEEVVNYYKDYAEYYKTDLATFLANYVGLSGITTEKEFTEYVTKDYKKTLTIKKFIADEAKEDDLKEYYKENFTDKLTVKHILIEVDPDAEDQEAADNDALSKAKKVIKKLAAVDKEDLESKFDELAEEYSDDTATYSKGGLLEDITKKDVVSEFWDAAYSLKDGEYTATPIKTTYGYHVILRVSTKKVEKYKDIKEEVKSAYAESLLSSDSTLFTTKWDELRKQYKLSIKDDNMKSKYEDSTKVDNDEKTED